MALCTCIPTPVCAPVLRFSEAESLLIIKELGVQLTKTYANGSEESQVGQL